MAEIPSIQQALALTPAAERVQEAARRKGDREQQAFDAGLDRRIDAREREVNPSEKPPPEALDGSAERDGHGAGGARSETEPAPADRPESAEEEDTEVGRHIDVRA